ncbi:MAG: DUF5658 family protein [Planctomycetota bacterium]
MHGPETPSTDPFAIAAADDSRRRGPDRRQRPTPFVSRYTWSSGRRRGARRDGERRDSFVDQHGATLFLVALAIVALNMLDAWFTMLLLSHGGEEANPVALFLLELGPWAFVAAKTLGIGLCTVVLVMIKNFRGARFGLGVVLAVYLLGGLGPAHPGNRENNIAGHKKTPRTEYPHGVWPGTTLAKASGIGWQQLHQGATMELEMQHRRPMPCSGIEPPWRRLASPSSGPGLGRSCSPLIQARKTADTAAAVGTMIAALLPSRTGAATCPDAASRSSLRSC